MGTGHIGGMDGSFVIMRAAIESGQKEQMEKEPTENLIACLCVFDKCVKMSEEKET